MFASHKIDDMDLNTSDLMQDSSMSQLDGGDSVDSTPLRKVNDFFKQLKFE